jgi:hypothetical protein
MTDKIYSEKELQEWKQWAEEFERDVDKKTDEENEKKLEYEPDN